MERTLVIGGTGFIGSRVVRQLVDAGRTVRCLVRKTSRTDRLQGFPIETFEGDLRDFDSLVSASAGCDSIIHLAGISAWDKIDSDEMFPVVVDGTQRVLDAAIQQGVHRLVYVSSAAAMGPSRDVTPRDENAPYLNDYATGMKYVLAKQEAEKRCLEASDNGLDVVIIRPTEVYGPHDDDLITAGNIIDMLQSSPVLICNGGTSLVHVDDVAAGIALALERGQSGEIYFVGGENLHHRELAQLVLELGELRRKIIVIPKTILHAAATIAKWLRLPFPIAPALVPYATHYWYIDNRKAKSELGLQFRTARETLSETISWLKSAGKI